MVKKPYLVYIRGEPVRFEWDTKKDIENQAKHGVSFGFAQYAFSDLRRVIIQDLGHSQKESRFICMGRIGEEVVTVRFTYRAENIRIIGAGYWRKGRRIYEKENQIHE